MNQIPDFLIQNLKNYYDDETLNKIINGYNELRYTTFRINTLHEYSDIVINNSIKVDNLPNAYILKDDKYDLFNSSYVKEGKIYLQSLSSMVPPYLINPSEKETILDMTAAPGSKTSLMCSLSNNKASITAVEIDKIRSERLKHNLNLLGCKNVTVLNMDALKLDDYFTFDKVLLDAPCSGSGTLSVHDDKIVISDKLIKNSSYLQHKLLEKAIKLTKKGGTIVYSTCSILKIENEEVLKPFISKNLIKVEKIDNFNLPLLPSSIDGVLTICPTKEYEGFFVAELIKL